VKLDHDNQLPEPLELEIWEPWIARVRKRLQDVGSDKAELVKLLRLSFHLCLLAPFGGRLSNLSPTDEPEFEAFLENGLVFSAAQMLVGEDTDLLLSRKGEPAHAAMPTAAVGLVAEACSQDAAVFLLSAFLESASKAHFVNRAAGLDQAGCAPASKSQF